jgi:hypothetical protein
MLKRLSSAGLFLRHQYQSSQLSLEIFDEFRVQKSSVQDVSHLDQGADDIFAFPTPGVVGKVSENVPEEWTAEGRDSIGSLYRRQHAEDEDAVKISFTSELVS